MAFRKLFQLPTVLGIGASCGVAGYIFGRKSNISEADFPFLTAKAATQVPISSKIPFVPEPEPKVPIESRASQIMKYGYPGFDNLRTFEDFVLSYNRATRIPHWVYEHLTPDRMTYDPSVDRSKCTFREDNSMYPYFQSKNADYKGSGFDRGHIAAAGNHRKSQNSVDQTFLLSNMAPQVGKGFNRGKWNQLEKYVRKLARKYPNVYICSGPLFLPRAESDGKLYVRYQVIGSSHVAVASHFFKVILVDTGSKNNFELECYVLPNQAIDENVDLKQFRVPLESIERAAGFLIFDKLAKSNLKKINGKSSGIF